MGDLLGLADGLAEVGGSGCCELIPIGPDQWAYGGSRLERSSENCQSSLEVLWEFQWEFQWGYQ